VGDVAHGGDELGPLDDVGQLLEDGAGAGVRGRRGGLHDAREVVDEHAEQLAEARVDGVVRGGEVVEDGAPRDPGPIGEVVDGEAPQSALRGQGRGGVDDGAAVVVLHGLPPVLRGVVPGGLGGQVRHEC